MNFKRTPVYIGFALFALILTMSCNDGGKKEEAEAEAIKIEKERVEKEAAEKAEMEKLAKEEEMKKVAMENSIAYKAKATEDLSTLVAALEAAELNGMLSEPGDYTVFAPSNNAFSKLPAGTVDNLVKPENKEQLSGILQYHVVAGTLTSDRFASAIKGANGNYRFKTVNGLELTAMMDGDQFVIMDSRGKKAHVVQGNVEASNGIVYVIDNVLMSKK